MRPRRKPGQDAEGGVDRKPELTAVGGGQGDRKGRGRKAPKTRYAMGFGAKPLIAARALLGGRQFDAVISRAIGLPRS
jgi:hypothetical protein